MIVDKCLLTDRPFLICHRQISNASLTVAGNKIVDHSDVVRACSTWHLASINWATSRQLRDATRYIKLWHLVWLILQPYDIFSRWQHCELLRVGGHFADAITTGAKPKVPIYWITSGGISFGQIVATAAFAICCLSNIQSNYFRHIRNVDSGNYNIEVNRSMVTK